MAGNKVSAVDVIAFFKEANLEVAELAFEFAKGTMAERSGKTKELRERMANARAARVKGGKAAAAKRAEGKASGTVGADAAAALPPAGVDEPETAHRRPAHEHAEVVRS